MFHEQIREYGAEARAHWDPGDLSVMLPQETELIEAGDHMQKITEDLWINGKISDDWIGTCGVTPNDLDGFVHWYVGEQGLDIEAEESTFSLTPPDSFIEVSCVLYMCC